MDKLTLTVIAVQQPQRAVAYRTSSGSTGVAHAECLRRWLDAENKYPLWARTTTPLPFALPTGPNRERLKCAICCLAHPLEWEDTWTD